MWPRAAKRRGHGAGHRVRVGGHAGGMWRPGAEREERGGARGGGGRPRGGGPGGGTRARVAPPPAAAAPRPPRRRPPPPPARLPAAGNPAGQAYVPPAGRPVSTRHPDHVIGSGTPASCTSQAVVAAVAAGGVITFSCGPRPVTITMEATAEVRNTSRRVVLDGGGQGAPSGGGPAGAPLRDSCRRSAGAAPAGPF